MLALCLPPAYRKAGAVCVKRHGMQGNVKSNRGGKREKYEH